MFFNKLLERIPIGVLGSKGAICDFSIQKSRTSRTVGA